MWALCALPRAGRLRAPEFERLSPAVGTRAKADGSPNARKHATWLSFPFFLPPTYLASSLIILFRVVLAILFFLVLVAPPLFLGILRGPVRAAKERAQVMN